MKFMQTMYAFVVVASFALQKAVAVDLDITVSNSDKTAVEDAVIELIPQFNYQHNGSGLNDEVAQKNRTFVPFVSAVKVGTEVHFPNYDKTRHHVYSFSEAKTFELQLYVGRPDSGIVFDKAGIVALGCNIHDYMQAFVYVGQGPFFGVSDARGTMNFSNLPDGNYQLNAWHPWQKTSFKSRQIVLKEHKTIELTFPVEKLEKPSPPQNKWQSLFEDNAQEL